MYNDAMIASTLDASVERMTKELDVKERDNSRVVRAYMDLTYRRHLMVFYFWLTVGVGTLVSLNACLLLIARGVRPALASSLYVGVGVATLVAIMILLLYTHHNRSRSATDWRKRRFVAPG
jgi:hypothetical protein